MLETLNWNVLIKLTSFKYNWGGFSSHLFLLGKFCPLGFQKKKKISFQEGRAIGATHFLISDWGLIISSSLMLERMLKEMKLLAHQHNLVSILQEDFQRETPFRGMLLLCARGFSPHLPPLWHWNGLNLTQRITLQNWSSSTHGGPAYWLS